MPIHLIIYDCGLNSLTITLFVTFRSCEYGDNVDVKSSARKSGGKYDFNMNIESYIYNKRYLQITITLTNTMHLIPKCLQCCPTHVFDTVVRPYLCMIFTTEPYMDYILRQNVK